METTEFKKELLGVSCCNNDQKTPGHLGTSVPNVLQSLAIPTLKQPSPVTF